MATPQNAWWDEMRTEAEAPPAPPPQRVSKAAAIGGAAVAVVAAAGLGWWFTAAEPTTFVNRDTARLQPAAAVAPVAPSHVDMEQVRQARDEFTATLAASGPGGLERFRMSCEASARADGRILDFCLAFDLMGDTVAAADAGAEARRLALVEAAVPGEPAPIRRVEAVRDALRSLGALPALPAVQPVAPPTQAPVETTPVARPAIAAAKLAPPKLAAAAPSRCRLLSIPADRLVCANPALKTQHARMRAAYDAALKAGADPLAIDRGQAEWRAQRNAAGSRAALAALYARRTAELKRAAEEARLTPPN